LRKSLQVARDELAAKRRALPWLSSDKSSFNYDFEVSFTPEQLEDKVARYNYRDGASFGPEMPGVFEGQD